MFHLPENLAEYAPYFDTENQIPHLTAEGARAIQENYFCKIGYAFGIEDPHGNIFVQPHKTKQDNHVEEGQMSVPSETIKATTDQNTITGVETPLLCLARTLLSEQGIDLRHAPEEAKLLIARKRPFSVLELALKEDDCGPKVFAMSIAVHSNLAMTEFITQHAQETEEAHPGAFASVHDLNKIIQQGRHRTSFDVWLQDYLEGACLRPEAAWETLAIPTAIEADRDEWSDLRFTETTHA